MDEPQPQLLICIEVLIIQQGLVHKIHVAMYIKSALYLWKYTKYGIIDSIHVQLSDTHCPTEWP